MNCAVNDSAVILSRENEWDSPQVLDNESQKTQKVDSMNAFFAAPQLDIAFEIGQSVHEVQAVFLGFSEEQKRFVVLTIVPERDRAVCRKVYSVEQQIIERYEGFDFTFSVLASNGKEPRAVIQDPSMYLAFAR